MNFFPTYMRYHRAFFFIVYGELLIYIYFLIHFLFPNAHRRLSLKASFLRRSFEGQKIRCKQILFNNRIQCHSFHLGQMPPDFSYPSNSIMAVDSSRSYFQLLPECVDCYRRLFQIKLFISKRTLLLYLAQSSRTECLYKVHRVNFPKSYFFLCNRMFIKPTVGNGK